MVQLSGKDRIISNGIPMAMGMSFMGGQSMILRIVILADVH